MFFRLLKRNNVVSNVRRSLSSYAPTSAIEWLCCNLWIDSSTVRRNFPWMTWLAYRSSWCLHYRPTRYVMAAAPVALRLSGTVLRTHSPEIATAWSHMIAATSASGHSRSPRLQISGCRSLRGNEYLTTWRYWETETERGGERER